MTNTQNENQNEDKIFPAKTIFKEIFKHIRLEKWIIQATEAKNRNTKTEEIKIYQKDLPLAP